jgi:type I restriction enzyme, S subunit
MSEGKTLGNQLQILSGFPFPSTDFTSERNGEPLIRIRDLQQQNPETYFSGDYDSSFLVSRGDVLVGMDGDFNAVKWQGPQALLNQRVCKITTKDPAVLNQDFLYHSLQPHLNNIHKGTAQTTVRHLSTKDLYGIDAELPPLPEQKKIAEILSGIDKEIAGVSQIIQGKRLFRESLLRQIIPHQSSFGDGLPPEGWNLVTIEEICSLITYGFTNPMPTSDRGIYMVTAKDVRDGKIDKGTARFTSVEAYETLLTDKSRPRRNDMLVTKDGTLGRTAVVGEETICINQSVALLRPSDEQNAQFLQLLLSSPQYQETMIEESGGSAVKHIYITTLAKMPIAIPSSPERREEVVGFCYSLNKSIDILLKKHDCLSNLKKGLASDLLSGSKRVSV